MLIFSSSTIWMQPDLINLLPSSCNVIVTSKWFHCRCRFNNSPPISLQTTYWLTELRNYTTITIFNSLLCLYHRHRAFDRRPSRHVSRISTMKLCYLKGWSIPATGKDRVGEGGWLGWKLVLAAVLRRLSSRRDISVASHTTMLLAASLALPRHHHSYSGQ